MTRLLTSLLCAIGLIAFSLSQPDSTLSFGFDLLDQISDETVVFSPLSLQLALAMTAAGARGLTLQEMRDVLHLSPSFVEDMAQIQSHLDSITNEDVSLGISNALFPDTSLALKQEFVTTITDHFNSTISSLDYRTDPNHAREEINKVVDELTHGLITELLPEGSIDGSTKLVLTNSIHFLGQWQNPFTDTIDMPFHPPSSDPTPLPFLSHYTGYHALHAATDQWQAVSIPYSGGDLALSIWMPTPGSPLTMTPGDWQQVREAMQPVHLRSLQLPKLSLRHTLPDTALRALDMELAFSGAADFGAISDAGLFIDSVYHQATLDLDLEGTEAAAATAVVMCKTSFSQFPNGPVFLADHPFMFLLHEVESGVPLFMGRFSGDTEARVNE
eukprot:gnl/Dysnectes_brevis/1819_a2088_2006.p1 GENE.gnl/Dysnectes_brevis/1819_a2088_2006~~gnl/Dysnectes_brevis/1819_a2088_2006.p1  ORF type:complete len:387 (-),score=112.63 gnl/Dysnectes_brevis/1819_a2088_2006:139-1299(-)